MHVLIVRVNVLQYLLFSGMFHVDFAGGRAGVVDSGVVRAGGVRSGVWSEVRGGAAGASARLGAPGLVGVALGFGCAASGVACGVDTG